MTKSAQKKPVRAKKVRSKKPDPSNQGGRGGLALRLLKWTTVSVIWGVIAAIGVIGWAAYDLPDIDIALKSQRPPSITLLASDGAEITTPGAGASVRQSMFGTCRSP